MHTKPLPKELLDVAELAKILQLSEATIRSDLSRRQYRLPPRLLLLGTNRLVWSRAAVAEWLEARDQKFISSANFSTVINQAATSSVRQL